MQLACSENKILFLSEDAEFVIKEMVMNLASYGVVFSALINELDLVFMERRHVNIAFGLVRFVEVVVSQHPVAIEDYITLIFENTTLLSKYT